MVYITLRMVEALSDSIGFIYCLCDQHVHPSCIAALPGGGRLCFTIVILIICWLTVLSRFLFYHRRFTVPWGPLRPWGW